MRVAVASLLALASMLACGRERPAATTGGCDEVVARWSATLGKASGACTTEADCACFNGGLEPAHSCGGVTDRATADALESIRDEHRKASCQSGIACAAWACAPKCVAGRCTNG